MSLIIHHWDADGICSAALLYNGHELMTPKIGNYFLTDDEIEKIKDKFDEIYIVDLALHTDSLKKLMEYKLKIKVFDHHLVEKVEGIEYINPIIEGEDEEKYPSASWVVNEYLGNKENLLAFLGVVGDWERRILKTRFYEKLKKFIEKNRIKFEEMLEMVSLIDSNYKVGDVNEIKNAVRFLSRGVNKEEILENRKWIENKMKIENEIEKILSEEGKKVGNILIKEMDCKYNIISTIARKLWEKNDYVIVVNWGYFDNDCQLYVRGNNVSFLIDTAKKRGYVAGGKKNVMGAIVPKDECEDFIKIILNELGGKK